jgi:hypothetical protein
MKIQDQDFNGYASGDSAVDGLKEISMQRIAEQHKTRRLLIIITAVLVIFASCIMVFSPEEKQGTSTIIGIVLLVFAMGSIGASQFVIKAGGWEVSTVEKQKPLNAKPQVVEENEQHEERSKGFSSAQ